jgi:uncharacterized protein (DUF1684 family)
MGAIALLDWRRKIADMYAAVRANPDPAAAHAIWQRSRNQLLATHSESPVPQAERPTFTGVPVAPYNPRLRFTARVDTGVERLRIEVRTGTDGLVSFERAGVVHLPDVGDLDVWWLASYGGGVFVPIRDTRTNGATYAGGRYVIDTVKGADLGGDDGYLVVDLNFAHNPSCAYDPAWACPLAPPGNVVPVAIDAGELMPTEKQGSSRPA